MKEIFARQKQLMEKFEEIEYANRLLEWRGVITEQYLESPAAQMKLRRYAWQVTEEVSEFLNHVWRGTNHELMLEEIADIFHFLVELMIVAGMEPGETTLEEAFQAWPITSQRAGNDQFWMHFVAELGWAMNLLKNRPWKQTKVEVDRPTFHRRLEGAFQYFIDAVRREGIAAAALREAYFGKAKTNDTRIEAGV